MRKRESPFRLPAVPWFIRNLAPAVAAILICFVPACGDEVPREEPAARPVKILVFGSGAAGSLREYPGQVSATRTAELSFDVPGTIVELPIQEGQRVEKGALLARLDDRDYKARADSEKSKMSQTGADFKRFDVLYKEKVIPRAQLDLKKSEYEVAEAAYREAEKALADARLTAPFTGVVARKLVDERESIQAKQPILTLQGEGGLQIEVNVPESVTALAKPGLSLEERNARLNMEVILTALPDRPFPARLTEFSTAADPVTRTYKATLTFEVPPDVAVLPGMTAKVVVKTSGASATPGVNEIPANAVLAGDDGTPYVWRVDSKSMEARRATVTVGEVSGSDIRVLSGLEDGDLIAISGMTNLREGMKVSRLND